MEYKEGDKVIYESGFGYDVGTYVKPSRTYYHHTMKLETGIMRGDNLDVLEDQLRPWSVERIKKLIMEFGRKSTSEILGA